MPAPTIESLKAKLQEGLDDVAAGRVIELNGDQELDEFFDDIIRRGEERLAQQTRHP